MTGSVKVEDRFESFSVSEMVISGQFYIIISNCSLLTLPQCMPKYVMFCLYLLEQF